MIKFDKKKTKQVESDEKYLVICQRKKDGLDVIINNQATADELNAIVQSIISYQSDNPDSANTTTH